MDACPRIAIVPVLAALAASASCSRSGTAPSPATTAASPALSGLKIVVAAAPDGGDPEDCPALAGTAFALLGGLDLEGDAKAVLSVAVGCETDATAGEGGGVGVSAEVALDVAAPAQPDGEFDGAGTAACRACAGPGGRWARTMATARAVRDALDLALAQERVSRLEDGPLAALLASPDGVSRSVLLAALEEAALRRLRPALDPAIRLLDAADDEVALRAVGVLSRLEDTAALKALGRAALTKRPEIPFAAVRAIADIDGPMARRALELVAGQAQDPVLAREANDLLEDSAGGGRD